VVQGDITELQHLVTFLLMALGSLCYHLIAQNKKGPIMEKIDVFTVRDLRERTGKLLRDAEQGRLSLVTKRGRPAFIAVPFDARLLELGLNKTLATRLFEEGVLSISQAAKVAEVPLEDFLEVLRIAGIAAVDYPPEELDEEMGTDL